MRALFNFSSYMGEAEQNQHKYIFDMGKPARTYLLSFIVVLTATSVCTDGNGWSGRFHRLQSTNSAVLKSTVRIYSACRQAFG